MPSLDLRYESYRVRVNAETASDLAWLSEVLECGFEAVAPGSSAADVSLTIDAARYDALLATGAAGAEVEGFAQDGEPYRLQRWGGAGSTIARDAVLPGFYLVPRSGGGVEILMRTQSDACRLALMRVVRELSMNQAVATGGVLIHGAAVGSPHAVIVMSGKKGSGKTTLLLSLLEHANAAYISNDRCLLRVDGAQATVRGLPTIVSISRSGLAAVPSFRERLFAARPDLIGSGGSHVGFGPQQLPRIMGVPRASSGPLAAFVFPTVSENRERLALRRLSSTEAIASLRGGLFRAGHATLLGQVFVSESLLGRSAWEVGARVVGWVADHIPCFAVALGGGAPPHAEECQALLTAISGAIQEPTC